MKLDFDAIQAITRGISYLSETQNGIQFHRFNRREEDYYQSNLRCYTTSGVKLLFNTDSTKLRIKVFVSQATPTNFFSHDILVNGEKIGDIKNFDEVDLPFQYDPWLPKGEFALGSFQGEFVLGAGMKEVCIVFPWSVNSMLEEMELDDGAVVIPVKKAKTIISYGDSITYGASVVYPSNRYTAQLAEALKMDEICKAVGGEIFCPELLSYAEYNSPHYVLVAYGTNEVHSDFEDFKERCMEFIKKISAVYKDASILALSPIWRTGYETRAAQEKFQKIGNVIRDTAALYYNVRYIDGYNLVPHDVKYFADSMLHPNDEGCVHYKINLLENIIKTGEKEE